MGGVSRSGDPAARGAQKWRVTEAAAATPPPRLRFSYGRVFLPARPDVASRLFNGPVPDYHDTMLRLQ